MQVRKLGAFGKKYKNFSIYDLKDKSFLLDELYNSKILAFEKQKLSQKDFIYVHLFFEIIFSHFLTLVCFRLGVF